jgi:hypothetical protein
MAELIGEVAWFNALTSRPIAFLHSRRRSRTARSWIRSNKWLGLKVRRECVAALAHPVGNEAAAATDLQTTPTLADAERFETADDSGIFEFLEARETRTLLPLLMIDLVPPHGHREGRPQAVLRSPCPGRRNRFLARNQ